MKQNEHCQCGRRLEVWEGGLYCPTCEDAHYQASEQEALASGATGYGPDGDEPRNPLGKARRPQFEDGVGWR